MDSTVKTTSTKSPTTYIVQSGVKTNYNDAGASVNDSCPLILRKLELGEASDLAEANNEHTVLLDKEARRRHLEQEEMNARNVFRGILRLSLLLIAGLYCAHLISRASLLHPQPPSQSDTNVVQTVCGDVIIQHPQKFNCDLINGKYVIVNRITGQISANGNDDKQDDDYNDNNTN
jgi:hypothetical protein